MVKLFIHIEALLVWVDFWNVSYEIKIFSVCWFIFVASNLRNRDVWPNIVLFVFKNILEHWENSNELE